MRLTPSFCPRFTHTGSPGGPRVRGGLTLVELLVVIVLITTLVATAIPIVSPGGEERRLREASRSVNTYLQGAQARAVETGRPFGVALHRQSSDTERGADNAKCVRLEYVEVPPTYSGFDETSAIRVAVNPQYNPVADDNGVGEDDLLPILVQFVRSADQTDGLPAGFEPDLIPTRFLRPGDVIDSAGRRFVLIDTQGLGSTQVAAESGFFEPAPGVLVTFACLPVGASQQTPREQLPDVSAEYDNTGAELPSPDTIAVLQATGQPLPPPPYWTTPAPYRIFRQPVPAAGEPYELPAGVAIDLQASVVGGVGLSQLYNPAVDYDTDTQGFPNDTRRTDPVLLLFSPEGAVSQLRGQVISDGSDDHNAVEVDPRTVTGTIALCVGRNELIPAAPFGEAVRDPLTRESFANPLALDDSQLLNLSEGDRATETNNYNWLNLESRWVIVGGQTGTVETIEGVSPEGLTTPEQLGSTTAQIGAVLENVANRRRAGGN